MFARLTAIDGGLQLVNVLQIGTVGPRGDGGSYISVRGVDYYVEVEQDPDQVDEACRKAVRRYVGECLAAEGDVSATDEG